MSGLSKTVTRSRARSFFTSEFIGYDLTLMGKKQPCKLMQKPTTVEVFAKQETKRIFVGGKVMTDRAELATRRVAITKLFTYMRLFGPRSTRRNICYLVRRAITSGMSAFVFLFSAKVLTFRKVVGHHKLRMQWQEDDDVLGARAELLFVRVTRGVST